MPPDATRPPHVLPAGRGKHRIRAFRAEEPAAAVARRMTALRLGSCGPGDIARALRLARKAALSCPPGRGGYDPARHAAALRLVRGLAGGRDRARGPAPVPDSGSQETPKPR